jgi:hypothetical protein
MSIAQLYRRGGLQHVAGTFTATTRMFLIDHPQDPANRTLAHSCVEAPEMLNVSNDRKLTGRLGATAPTAG